MPSFDVVSEIDQQEVRNAVDQAQRELANRFDFKDTGSAIEEGKDALTLRSSSEDRLAALRQVLEEKFVKRKLSLKTLDWGKVEEASGATVRQVVGLKAGIDAETARDLNKRHQGDRREGRPVLHAGRLDPGDGQEARRPAGRDRLRCGRPTSTGRCSSTTSGTDRQRRRYSSVGRRRRPAPDLLHDTGIGERGGVPEVAALGDVAQEPAHDLAAAGLRQVVGEDHRLRPGRRPDLGGDVATQLLAELVPASLPPLRVTKATMPWTGHVVLGAHRPPPRPPSCGRRAPTRPRSSTPGAPTRS
jgi:hypothetical protein